ncbi:uncharacterized protein C8A04DRAFT_12761 [Dichotomopilus funicola]|uniref:DUF6603 domain-containing protein n=1 Tax=Dichotomopilus funicola TaxID=1934379 RepID=A0AAN6V3S1_9PEZI|nr:hypothetical protein C8A04DRAFT_12761 [Dichotomopilus funicola]
MITEITPYHRRLVAQVPGANGRIAGSLISTPTGPLVSAAADDTKYYIYSSKSGQQSSATAHVLTPSAATKNIDTYLSLLPDEGITLAAKPSGTDTSAVLDESDKWATWFTHWDANGGGNGNESQVSVAFDNATDLNIQSFSFRLALINKDNKEVVFTSTPDTLAFTFGADPVSGLSRVPAPGMFDDGAPLYFGLDPAATTTDPTATVAELFAFAGLGKLLDGFPIQGLDLVTATLKRNKAGERRNALWFSPAEQLKGTMRVEFELDEAKVLEDVLTAALPGLEFAEGGFTVAAKKLMVLGETSEGKGPIVAGEVEFGVKCTVGGAGMLLSLVVTEDWGLEVSLKMESGDGLGGIVKWLVGLLPGDAGMDGVEGILDNLFKGWMHLQRVKVTVDVDDDGKPSLAGVRVEIEVSGDFGQGSNLSKRPAFLLGYNWSAELGGMGSINGDFWTWFDTDGNRVLDPYYSEAEDIQPFTTSPATEIDLTTLIPNHTIDNIPANVPTKITTAGLYLSQTQFSFRTTIQSQQSTAGEQASTVPQVDLGRINLAAQFDWDKRTTFQLQLGIMAILTPSTTSKHQTSAILSGSLDYDSANKSWALKASLRNLYASTLWEFFDKNSVDHVIPLIDSLEIDHLTLDYTYTGNQSAPGLQGKSVGTHFAFDGLIFVADLALKLDFTFDDGKGWKFTASLKAQDKEATLGDILDDMLGDSAPLDLPPFIADTKINGNNNEGGIHLAVEKTTGDEEGIQFMGSVQIGELALVLAQLHLKKWDPKLPPKRLVKFGLVGLPEVDLPLIGNFAQPFDELYVMWVQDKTGQNKNKATPGLTRAEIDVLNKTLSLTGHPLVAKDRNQTKDAGDVLISAGSHFAVVTKSQQGERTCVLDYEFKKAKPKQQKSVTGGGEEEKEEEKEKGDPPAEQDSDGTSSTAPFKKKSGPVQINNIGLEYANKTLHIKFTATFELGPLAFSLIGFRLNIQITSLALSGIQMLLPTLEGLAASFEKPPLTLAGLIRHGKSKDGLDYYAGGIIVGWVPYQLQAAGFYGEALPEGGQKPQDIFRSVFVFARLDGPLVTLEFAEISGVTGGFGYNSEVRVPTADQIVNFPFVKSTSLSGATESAITTLERLTSPASDGWFHPRGDTYWAAAGMKIDAFQMISLDAVAVIQFGQSIKMGLFAVALADIPTSASKVKFAHVELGLAVVIDLDYGTFRAESQLSPNSYILDPNCHLTGGFALCYWFDAPHADRSLIGDFAYFAITPKACMGGGRLHAAFHAGPIEAWFDAFADFLINYKPFHFLAEAGVSVGVRFNLDVWLIHIHISVEVGADLTLWGPPMAGTVHVDIKVHKFDINFGSGSEEKGPADLLGFYHLVLQASSKTDPKKAKSIAREARTPTPGFNPRIVELDDSGEPLSVLAADADDDDDTGPPKPNEGHTFLAQTGLMNDTDKPERSQNQTWTVRGGTFSFVLGCKMAIAKAEQVDSHGNVIPDDPDSGGNPVVEYTDNAIHARPMHLGQGDVLDSSVTISITEVDSDDPPRAWPMEKFVKSVPTGLWGVYDASLDPKQSGNNITTLLNPNDGGIPLMMGVLLTGPPPTMSEDKLQTFIILDADRVDLDAKKLFPAVTLASGDWVGIVDPPDAGTPKQWEDVRKAWETPAWDQAAEEVEAAGAAGAPVEGEPEEVEEAEKTEEAGEEPSSCRTQFVKSWAEAFGWDTALAGLAGMPSLLNKRFDNLYVAAPLLTK